MISFIIIYPLRPVVPSRFTYGASRVASSSRLVSWPLTDAYTEPRRITIRIIIIIRRRRRQIIIIIIIII